MDKKIQKNVTTQKERRMRKVGENEVKSSVILDNSLRSTKKPSSGNRTQSSLGLGIQSLRISCESPLEISSQSSPFQENSQFKQSTSSLPNSSKYFFVSI